MRRRTFPSLSVMISPTSSVASKRRKEAILHNRLQEYAEEFEELAERCGLPWLDRDAYRRELFANATVALLPRIASLVGALRRKSTLSSQILTLCARREQLVDTFVDSSAPCMQVLASSSTACSDRLHQRLCVSFEEIDHFTDAIIALVEQWREGLSLPLPFMVSGENYLVRMTNQYAPSRILASISMHLRSACRTKPFLYQSPYDMSVAESLMTHERMVLMRELKVQMGVCREMLSLAKSGQYRPVLNIPLSKAHVTVTRKKWKQLLVVAYAGALHDVTVALNASSATRVASQFVQCSSRALHLRYYRTWMERTLSVRARRATCASLLSMTIMAHLRTRFHTWSYMRDLLHSQQDKVRGICAAANRAQLQRFMRKWFFFHKGSALFRAVQRSLGLTFFRRLHCKVICRRHSKLSTKYRALSFVSLMGPAKPMLQMVVAAGDHKEL